MSSPAANQEERRSPAFVWLYLAIAYLAPDLVRNNNRQSERLAQN
jgi:hypothetical protein